MASAEAGKSVWLHYFLGKHESSVLHKPPGPGEVIPSPNLGATH